MKKPSFGDVVFVVFTSAILLAMGSFIYYLYDRHQYQSEVVFVINEEIEVQNIFATHYNLKVTAIVTNVSRKTIIRMDSNEYCPIPSNRIIPIDHNLTRLEIGYDDLVPTEIEYRLRLYRKVEDEAFFYLQDETGVIQIVNWEDLL